MTSETNLTAEQKVRSWGFEHVYTWSDSPYIYLTILYDLVSPELPIPTIATHTTNLIRILVSPLILFSLETLL